MMALMLPRIPGRSVYGYAYDILSDLQASIREQSRKSDEAINAMDAMQREREHNSEKERIQLQSKIAEIAEEVGKKILQRELKLREDTRQKFSQLEQALTYEQEARQKFEKETREENEQRWESLKRLSDEELQQLKEQIKNEKKKTTETLHNLNKAVNLIEKQMEEHKKQQDKLLSAEIKSRKQAEKETTNKIDKLEDKLRVATNTLQDALGSTAGQVTLQGEKIRNELKEEIEEVKKAETRHVADLDARLLALNNKITQSEDKLEAKIHTMMRKSQINEEMAELNEGKKLQEQQIQELVTDYHMWKDVTERTVEELKKQSQQLPKDMYELEEKIRLHKTATESQLNAETENRKVQLAELKEELERRIPGTPKEPSNKDIEACQSSIRKLAESIQTVKTVLGMKIQSEQKLRETTIQNIQEELEEIQKKLKEGEDNKKDDKDDKKDDKKDDDDDDDDKKDDNDDKDDKKGDNDSSDDDEGSDDDEDSDDDDDDDDDDGDDNDDSDDDDKKKDAKK